MILITQIVLINCRAAENQGGPLGQRAKADPCEKIIFGCQFQFLSFTLSLIIYTKILKKIPITGPLPDTRAPGKHTHLNPSVQPCRSILVQVFAHRLISCKTRATFLLTFAMIPRTVGYIGLFRIFINALHT